MKKSMIRHALVIWLIVALISGCVYAGYVDSEEETKANIKFIPNTEEITPVDPDEPGNPDPGLPPVVGPLVILHASDFMFGTEMIAAGKQEIDIQTIKPNIQIADLRGNSGGWSLEVSVSRFKEDEKATLTGAAIYIKDGRLNSETPMAYAPTVHTERMLPTDGTPVKLMTADTGKGQGIWVNRFYPVYTTQPAIVQLQIPAGMATPGTHSAIMTWTLLDTP